MIRSCYGSDAETEQLVSRLCQHLDVSKSQLVKWLIRSARHRHLCECATCLPANYHQIETTAHWEDSSELVITEGS